MMRGSDVLQQIHQSATKTATKLTNQINRPRLFQHLLYLLLSSPRCAEVTQKKAASQRRRMTIKVILISRSSRTVPAENTKITANGGQTFRDETKKKKKDEQKVPKDERGDGERVAKMRKMSRRLLETH